MPAPISDQSFADFYDKHLVPSDARWARGCLKKASDWSKRDWKQMHYWLLGTRLAIVGAGLSTFKDIFFYTGRGIGRFTSKICHGKIKQAFVHLGSDSWSSLRSLALTVTIAAAAVLSILVGSKIFRLLETKEYISASCKKKATEQTKENSYSEETDQELDDNLDDEKILKQNLIIAFDRARDLEKGVSDPKKKSCEDAVEEIPDKKKKKTAPVQFNDAIDIHKIPHKKTDAKRARGLRIKNQIHNN